MTDLSIDARLLAPDNHRNRSNRPVVAVAAAALILGALVLGAAITWRQGALFLVGGALGLSLYHALFGFTSAWRVFIVARRGAGLRAQMVMLAIAVILFFPALAHGTLFGQPVHGEYGAVGIGMLTGAFLFGLGMQMGGGCASGTLYTAGGGNTRMLVTLAAFIVGSTIGARHLPWWSAQPNIGAVSLIDKLGWMPALIVCLVVMAGIYVFTLQVETHSHGAIEPGVRTELTGARRFLQGPWPLLWGAVALALGNFATLFLAGRPWGITSAFALWGSKIAMALGVDVASWGYWQGARAASLQQSIFADITSVMDFGIMLGALLAAGLAGKFHPTWRLPLPSLLAAIIGGLLLGYGARLAYGCNIGAYFSGIASGSLHGWCWFVAAFIGNMIGTQLRPLFGLTVERGPVPAAKPA
ncbi:YeeE/YedE family protein [Bradyrhizobium sp. SRS-191]|uniref:YeeE/YedE family protein n=1 Tax=Bradyrhizobium sp. SRS-191 TaxID=2962606 RepID=UPI00211F087E|nr:YeeE/YedE family protein [Bradyrhizobium sp. SRS-191]